LRADRSAGGRRRPDGLAESDGDHTRRADRQGCRGDGSRDGRTPRWAKQRSGLWGLGCRVGDNVCSPGGLTIAAIESLEKNGFRSAAMQAVIAVASKSIEMRNAEEDKRTK
ncbi:unnamed protein product, partial [Ectocarpus sp. 8 AP-2014]